MKKLLSIIVALGLVLAVSSSVLAGTINNSKIVIQADGTAMSASEFSNIYSGDPESRMPATYAKSIKGTTITLNNIDIKGDDVSFVAELTINDTKFTLSAKGKLSSGYKTQHGINSIIIDIPGPVDGFDFLLFEIYNDSAEDNLLVSNQHNKNVLSTSPHLKIYLQDEYDTLYLFETEMPAAFSDLNAANYQKANKYSDLFWAIDLVKYETLELPTDSAMLATLGLNINARGLNKFTIWTNPRTFVHTFYIGSDLVKCYSLPYVEYKHVNVSGQDSTWIASFKVAEHTNISGDTYHGNNVFEYRNLKIAFACGDNTTFIRTYQEGRVYDYRPFDSGIKSIGEEITVSLLNKAVSALPYGATFQTVLGYINTMSSANGDVMLGSTGVTLSNRKTTAVGEKLTHYSFEECTDYGGSTNIGHYFTYQAVLQYEAASGNTNTVGALLVEFDKFYTGDSSLTTISQSFQLDYSSQP